MIVKRFLDHSFCPQILQNSKVAIDCGANRGEFSTWLSRNTSIERIYGFEADPEIFTTLRKTQRVEWIPKAVYGETGKLSLSIGETNCSSLVYAEHKEQLTCEVDAVSLNDFCDERGIRQIDLLKLDIEGAELSVLEGATDQLLSHTKQITVEFHDFINMADVPRIRRIFQRLQSLGFFSVKFSHHTWGDCLFLNSALVDINLWDRVYIGYIAKYGSGLGRVIGRRVKRSSAA